MATTSKSGSGSKARSSKRRSSDGGSGTRTARSSSSKRTATASTRRSTSGPRKRSASTPRATAPSKAAEAVRSDDGRLGTIAKAAGALAGTAAVAVAGRAAMKKSRRRPRVLGMTMPRSMKPKIDLKKLDVTKKLDLKKVDPKKVAKQLADVAERVEKTSEEVRVVSGQAKRVTRTLS